MSAARRQPPCGNERAGGEREQLAVARGDRGAEETDPQREVLNDGTGRRESRAERAAPDDLEQRQDDHRQQRQRRERIFDGGSHTVPRRRRVVVNGS